MSKGEAPRALPDHLHIWLSLVALKGSEGFWKVPLTLETYLSVPHGTRHDGTPSWEAVAAIKGLRPWDGASLLLFFASAPTLSLYFLTSALSLPSLMVPLLLW